MRFGSSSDAMLLCTLLLSVVSSTQGLPSGFIAEVVAEDSAVTGTFAPNPKTGDQLLLIVSKTGKVRVIEDPDNGSSKAKTILDLEDKMCKDNERGLQTVTIHPNFTENRYVYLFYTKFKEGCLADKKEPANAHPWNVVSRFVMDPESLMLDFDSREEIWRGAPLKGYSAHNGGAMTFGNDGKLYVTHGDGGVQDNAQDMSTVLGSIIRLDDDGSTPHDNPFTTDNGYNAYPCRKFGGKVPANSTLDAVCSEIFANGLRNPFRIAVDSNEKEKVRFSIQDVGARVWEELSYGGTDYAGVDYGYKPYEGPCLRHSDNDCPIPEDPNIVEPFHYYLHRSDNSGCVSGAAFVPEEAFWPEEYKLLFADFVWYEVYNLIEDPDNECRTCTPPISKFRNETFFEPTRYPGEGKNEAKIVDMFFGPYKNTQALYVVKYGNHDTVIRIRYTGNHDEPPIVNFTVSKQNVDLNEQIQFDGSRSNDPEGEEISFAWYFGDGEKSTEISPIHTYRDPGAYKITLFVTDVFNQVQQKSMTIMVGDPPNTSILSPAEGDEFYVGQVIRLEGKANHLNGTAFEDSKLQWEVRRHHDDHYHPFLDPTFGNNFDLFPAPEPEDFYASTNSYLEIILFVTDDNGLTTKVSRVIQPSIVEVSINSNLLGLNILVNDESVSTSSKIVSWKDQHLHLMAKSDPSYHFVSWSDGVEEKNRSVVLNYSDPVFTAIFCALNGAVCSNGLLCCNGFCHRSNNSSIQATHKASKTEMICVEELPPTDDPTSSPTKSPTGEPTTFLSTGLETNVRPGSPEFETNRTDEDSAVESKSPATGSGPSQIDKDIPEKESEAGQLANMNPFLLVVSALSVLVNL